HRGGQLARADVGIAAGRVGANPRDELARGFVLRHRAARQQRGKACCLDKGSTLHVDSSRFTGGLPDSLCLPSILTSRYLPMQNRPKMTPSRSSAENSPVIAASACCASRNS